MTAVVMPRGFATGIAAKASPFLAVEDITVRFGGIVALDGVSFTAGDGQIVGLIGPNGAGKTTLFNVLSRLYRPISGDVRFNGRSLLDLAPHEIGAAGIGRTFQNLALFKSMTVLDNVIVGAHAVAESDFLGNALRLPSVRAEERELRTLSIDLLSGVGLADVAQRPVADLPFGTQKRVEVARALACSPKLLLLDEPAGGLNHEEVGALGKLVRGIRDTLGMTILLVEHHMSFVMGTADKVVAFDFGRVIAEGSPQDVQANDAVIEAYLGRVR
jgi:branched-chain amino acid transport system ATP-binding protein